MLDVVDADNVEVRELDLRSDALPREEFDLVCTRFVLGHVPKRVEILDSLVAALRPDGWLLLEEMNVFAWGAIDSGLHPDVALAGVAAIEGHGFAPRWGREIPAPRDRGLVDISAVAEAPIVQGGCPGLEWLRLSFDQMWPTASRSTCRRAQLRGLASADRRPRPLARRGADRRGVRTTSGVLRAGYRLAGTTYLGLTPAARERWRRCRPAGRREP